MSSETQPLTLYFGYGSNLWLDQMDRRCPESIFVGIARLPSFFWIINQRGYANVVEKTPALANSGVDEVWGLVYKLSPHDESNLDENEGVPISYTKEYLDVELWRAEQEGNTQKRINVGSDKENVKVLVYINRKQVEESQPKTEYIYRMNMGIADATRLGIPQEYVDKVIRRFIPPENVAGTESYREQALQQARNFKEEE